MVSFYALSIFLLHVVTVFGSQFWHDVDTLHNELSSPRDLPRQSIINEAQHVALYPSPSPNEMDENQSECQGSLIRKFIRRKVTLTGAEVETFNQTIIFDTSYPQNQSLEEIENKLQALGDRHEWHDIHTSSIVNYSRYWGKLCILFSGKPVVKSQNYACLITPSYGFDSKRMVDIGNMKLFLDLLTCKCHMYERNYNINVSTPETILIHKSSENEYFIFETAESMNNRNNLSIKDFKGGITLPNPADHEHGRSLKYVEKRVSLNSIQIRHFIAALAIDNSYPKNITLAAVTDRLNTLKDVHEWPNLQKYDVKKYSRYWAKVCVSLWDIELDSSHRQSCTVSPSYGIYKKKKLFLSGRILHFDLLFCKCHSYTTTYRKPESAADTFLIHQMSANEYIVFEQHETDVCQFTLSMKKFEGGIILPDPDTFNN